MNLDKQEEIVDMRDAFFNNLYGFIEKDENIIILTADHGAFGLKKIEQDFPQQYLNVGIAEQALVGIAAGLAKCGKKVYIYAINNFVSLRTLEQVNIDICAMNLDVNIIGVGAGFTYSTDGPTHHGVQDMSMMANLPNLEVYNVTDDISTKKLAEISYNKSGPKYFRIEKGIFPRIYQPTTDLGDGCKIISDKNVGIGIISTGFMTQVASKLVEDLEDQGISVSHLDVLRVSPLPVDEIKRFTKNKQIITIEENLSSGGLSERIFSLLKKNNHIGRVLELSVDDGFYFSFGDRELLHRKAGLDRETVLKKIKDFIVMCEG